MLLNIRTGRWRFTLILTPVTDTIGVNSKLPDGHHILMWDWDNATLNQIIKWLTPIQWFYELPNIYILNTGKPNSYIAYCFKRLDFLSVCSVIASTPGICYNFFKWGVFRKRFTLRVGAKCGRIPKWTLTLKSKIPEDAHIAELMSWVNYETVQDKFKHKAINIGRSTQ